MQIRQIAAIALILTGAVACTSSGSDGRTSAPTSTLPTSSAVPTTASPTVPSTSPTPTPTVATTGPNVRPGEKPPMLDALALRNTAAGADVYARYWMRTLDWSYATTDAAATQNVYASSCSGCVAFVRNIIDSTKVAGQHFLGGRISVVSSSVTPGDNHNGATEIVDLTFKQSALTVASSAGHRVDTAPAIQNGTFRNWLRWTGRRWIVVDWKRATK